MDGNYVLPSKKDEPYEKNDSRRKGTGSQERVGTAEEDLEKGPVKTIVSRGVKDCSYRCTSVSRLVQCEYSNRGLTKIPGYRTSNVLELFIIDVNKNLNFLILQHIKLCCPFSKNRWQSQWRRIEELKIVIILIQSQYISKYFE